MAKIYIIVSLSGSLELTDLNYIDFRRIKVNAELLRKFFLFNTISLTLIKLFPK